VLEQAKRPCCFLETKSVLAVTNLVWVEVRGELGSSLRLVERALELTRSLTKHVPPSMTA
jgi:hypothetical protein